MGGPRKCDHVKSVFTYSLRIQIYRCLKFYIWVLLVLLVSI